MQLLVNPRDAFGISKQADAGQAHFFRHALTELLDPRLDLRHRGRAVHSRSAAFATSEPATPASPPAQKAASLVCPPDARTARPDTNQARRQNCARRTLPAGSVRFAFTQFAQPKSHVVGMV